MAVVPAGKLAADVGLGVIGTVMAVCTQQRDDEATCKLLSEAMVVTRAWPQWPVPGTRGAGLCLVPNETRH